MSKSNHCCLKYEGSKQGKKVAHVHSLAPPLIRISVRPGKMVRGFLDFLFGEQFHHQYLQVKKKNFKRQSFLRYGGSNIHEKLSEHLR
jgi:hypothetical protein